MGNKVLGAMKKAGKPVRPGEVSKMIGEESQAVSKIISSLKNKDKVVSPKKCYYIPSDVPATCRKRLPENLLYQI